MENAKIRKATLEDYDGVMAIGLFYDGLDYLPSFYNKILTDPDYRSCVCEVDGEIVAFACALVHDGGTTMQVRSARIKATHRSHGHLREMREWGFRYFVTMNKAAHYVISIRFRNEDMWQHVDKDTLLDTVDVHLFPVKQDTSIKYAMTLPRLTADNMNDLLDSKTSCQRLFPKGLLYVYVIALGLHKGNVRHIIKDNTAVFATLSPHTGEQSAESPGKIDPDRISLLTIGDATPIKDGIHYVISVFGDDYKTYDDHVQSHLAIAKSLGHAHMYLGILVSEDFPKDLLEHTKSTYSSGPGNPPVWEFAALKSDITSLHR